ncbi:neprilysin-4-like [Colias croceus]|uniref:neprilysin-4-like n=1 Tax=Colias crocea TaxID=72248 RepID=UPI001E28014D|nr:neprilysin-4-like [Colias croceus]
MTRVDTPPQAISVKPKSANLCRFLSIISITAFAVSLYFIYKKPFDSLGDPSDQIVIQNIPKTYSKLETVDPEERDVFEGFRTSFLPPNDDFMARRYADRNTETYYNVANDQIQLGTRKSIPPKRIKRRSQFKFTSEEDEDYLSDQTEEDEDVSEIEESNEKDPNDQYDDDGKLQSVVHPELYVDRGPLDDVEQVRRQPELEEGEMSSAAHVYKPVRSYAGIHAFWKGQGDRDTIRSTQAKIMTQYMDAEADPCHDFYQYACGNWPALNPIPADKAGYDTFEMLRENLDAVLKDLLEFKSSEYVTSIYPGPHLDLEESFLKVLRPSECPTENINNMRIDIILNKPDDISDNVNEQAHYEIHDDKNKSEIINRIRRYLDKISTVDKSLPRIKYNIHEYYFDNKRKGKSRIKRQHRIVEHINRVNRIRRKKFYKRDLLQGRRLLTKKRVKRRQGIDDVISHIKRIPQKPDSIDPAHGDATLKARYLFKSCMNHEILKQRAQQPLLDLLDLFGGWPILKPDWTPGAFDWLELMAKLRLFNNDILISEWVGPDIKNSDEYVIQFDQTSLGLPTRDYFLQGSNRVYLEAYKTYLIKIATLLGGKPGYVKASADKLIDFEIKLAKITSAPEDRRNVSELYRRMTLAKLQTLVPEVDWKRYLCIVMNRTVHSEETVVLFALNYVRHLVQLIETTDPNTLANYLLWRFVRHRVNNLDDRFQSVKQQFYFILFGREQSPPRWKNCISQVNSNMGMALGSMFVRKYFDEMSKNDTLTMTREIQQSFRDLLHMTNWIDDETKKLAAHKVDSMMLRIGYPDFILDKIELDERYKEVRIHPDKYFENILNILQHLTKMEQSRIGQPVNKTLWNTAPAVVNAYYSRNKNQIMFPAGILQPPFYHRHFPRSLNFGGIGVVIGHEITHGFDDKGRLFDCEGNLHRWWSDTAIEAFHKRAQCLIDQYGQYVVPEVNMKLDGVNTQGENIADNGGVKQAFHAYQHWLRLHDASDETLPGLNHTHTQLFFLNFAQVWCGAMRPEAMRNKLKTAVHSPGRFRVIGTLSNSKDFAREFNCPLGSPMNPVQKCSVW